MKIKSNAHTHTTFCDGANTPEEMADRAIHLGFTDLGFSSHSPTPFDLGCLGLADETAYQDKIHALQKEYAGRLYITCGVETDFYAPVNNKADYDYIVGSVHYLQNEKGEKYSVDASPEQLAFIIETMYGGDNLKMAAAYYDLVVKNVQQNHPQIVGHFDLVTKFNENGEFFDERSSAYQKIALNALEAVCAECELYGGIIEINTGAISRGYRTTPYPAPFLLEYLASKNARVMINSDSHSVKTLDCWFDKAVSLAQKSGLKTIWELSQARFVEKEL